jgi:methyl-accepting chemotaxis protein
MDNAESVSAAANEMADTIRAVTQTLEQNAANIESLEHSSNEGKADAQVVVEGVRSIAQESEGLKEINAVIENIASQTNLLSMNAAIEAAHAGEVGKGFAVVADEIRKLAENSSEQSKTISSILQKIQTSIDGITASTDVMLKGFDTIEEGVAKVSRQEGVIRESMLKQDAGSQNISASVEKLKEITENVKKSSGSIANEGTDVQNKTTKLTQVTTEIQYSMTEIAAGAEQISIGITNINEISVKNKQNITMMDNEITKFKVA